MFICAKCAPDNVQWLFGLAMGISYGPCEICKHTAECIDHHGTLDSSEKKPKCEPLDTYRYDHIKK